MWYSANWDHPFFGIVDGMVSEFPVAEVTPDRNGRFTVEVPDFASDGVTKLYKGQANWSVAACSCGKGNDHVYVLGVSKESGQSPRDLAIEREYPSEIVFMRQP